jgi:hypothetical protein
LLFRRPVRPNWKKLWLGMLFAAVLILVLDVGCVFRRVTGIPCPGCGMTRAHLAALQLDFKTAFFYHPLWFLPVPLIGLQILFPEGIFERKSWNQCLIGFLIVVVLGTYIIRMLLFFPDTPPMEYTNQSVFGWLASVCRLAE